MKYILLLALLSLFKFNSLYAQKSQTGVITAIKGKIVSVKLDSLRADIQKSTLCSMYKDLSGTKNPFGIKVTSGWLEIADVTVKTMLKKMLELEIVKEKTNIVVNGKKQEQFVVGKKIKIDWK